MERQFLVDVTIVTTRLRLALTVAGYVVTRTCFDRHQEPKQIRRWRFPLGERVATAAYFMDEALAAAEQESCALRAAAEQATRRALVVGERTRGRSAAVRALEADAAAAMNAYLRRSQEFATSCAQAHVQLRIAGFPAEDHVIPAWMAEVQRILRSSTDDEVGAAAHSCLPP